MPDQIFLDTNILVYSRDDASPFYSHACEALKGLVGKGHGLSHILTLNKKYFECFQEIEPFTPELWKEIG